MILQVDLSDDGRLDYKLRVAKGFTARQYGALLATIAMQVSIMFEKEAGFDSALVLAQIAQSFEDEIAEPSSRATLDVLQ